MSLCQLLLLCSLCAVSLTAPWSATAAEEPEKKASKASPAELLKIWNDYGLPLPPPEVPLVRFTTGWRSVENGTETPHYSLGFLLEPGAKDKKTVILAGYTRHEEDRGDDAVVEKIEPVAAALKGLHFSAEFGIMESNSLLGTAIQCEARGWTEFAREVLVLALGQDAGHSRSITYQAAGMEGSAALHVLLWCYLQTEAMQPGSDRAALAAKMKRLLEAGHDLPRNGGRWLHDALSAAAKPGNGKPGTPEAVIDRLVDSQKGWAMGGGEDAAAEDPYYQLEALGFAAVPALLEHTDDPRLTCSMKQGFNNFPGWPRRVGDLVSDLLQDLSGGELGAGWLDRQRGDGVASQAAREWWEKARAAGEETWLVQGAVAKENSGKSFPNYCPLRILRARYPQRLADVLRSQMKERPKAQIHPVITALEESKLPEAEKIDLLMTAAVHENPETRRAALMGSQQARPRVLQLRCHQSLRCNGQLNTRRLLVIPGGFAESSRAADG